MVLWGGLTTNFIWCMILNARNKTFGDYTNKKTPLANNYIFAALAGTTWFLQFFFYGMGESKLGNSASGMDPAYGLHYFNGQCLGVDIERMGRRKQENQNNGYCRNYYNHCCLWW